MKRKRRRRARERTHLLCQLGLDPPHHSVGDLHSFGEQRCVATQRQLTGPAPQSQVQTVAQRRGRGRVCILAARGAPYVQDQRGSATRRAPRCACRAAAGPTGRTPRPWSARGLVRRTHRASPPARPAASARGARRHRLPPPRAARAPRPAEAARRIAAPRARERYARQSPRARRPSPATHSPASAVGTPAFGRWGKREGTHRGEDIRFRSDATLQV